MPRMRYYRRKKKISYRWRKRTVKRYYRKYRNSYRKRRVNNYSKMSARKQHGLVVRNARKYTVFRPLADIYNMLCTQGQTMRYLTLTDFTTATRLGHAIFDFQMGDFMTPADITYINAKYRFWELKEIHVSVKVVSFANWIKFTNIGATTIQFGQTEGPQESNQTHNLWYGVFKSAQDQVSSSGIDPDEGLGTPNQIITTRQQLLTNFYYRRLTLKGNILNFHWYQPTATSGTPTPIPVLSETMTLYTGAGTGAPANNQPHGYDFMLMDRGSYATQTTPADRLNLCIQVLGTAKFKTYSRLKNDF